MKIKNSGIKGDAGKYLAYRRWSWFILLIGLLIISMGVFQFVHPKIGISLKNQHPIVINGTLYLFSGIVLSITGMYRVFNSREAFAKKKRIEAEIKEIENKNRKKLFGS